MPILESSYHHPVYLFNRHLQTIIPVFGVKRNNSLYLTEKEELADGDFIELDWIRGENNKLMVLFHGLEGNSRSHYVQQTAEYFSKKGWDILAIHARSCGREMNRLPILYHGGATNEIDEVITKYAKNYDSIVLTGFSLGANMALNYVGKHKTPENLRAITTFSAPLDLRKSEQKIDKLINRVYAKQFLDKLKNKVRKLEVKHPGIFNLASLDRITSIQQFSENFTAPFCGFNTLDDFYNAGGCLNILKEIKIPTLIVNAKNDPFLSDTSYPVELASKSNCIFLETPKSGGHTAFPISKTESWMPNRIETFLNDVVGILK
jgi:predicted alpha/beta-fold hydrolase